MNAAKWLRRGDRVAVGLMVVGQTATLVSLFGPWALVAVPAVVVLAVVVVY